MKAKTIKSFINDSSKSILWIYGRSGCGKTKLVDSLIEKLEGKRVCPLTAEGFLYLTVELIKRHESLASLISYCQDYDLMVLDNIDVKLRNKPVTQKEIKRILFEIVRNKKTKVVLISERRPRKLAGLKFHTKDCYYLGLKMPEYNFKIDLLRYWAKQKDILVPEKVVLNIVRASENLFQLKGLFNKFFLTQS